MAKRRYIKKQKPNPEFPYKPIKDTLNWKDAQSQTGWLTFDQMKKLTPALAKTKGWIFEETVIPSLSDPSGAVLQLRGLHGADR